MHRAPATGPECFEIRFLVSGNFLRTCRRRTGANATLLCGRWSVFDPERRISGVHDVVCTVRGFDSFQGVGDASKVRIAAAEAGFSQPVQALTEDLRDQIGITARLENKAIAASVSKHSAYGRDFAVRDGPWLRCRRMRASPGWGFREIGREGVAVDLASRNLDLSSSPCNC